MRSNNKHTFSDSDFPAMKLPKNHRQEFIQKLRSQPIKKSKSWSIKRIVIAASVILATTIGYLSFNALSEDNNEKSMAEQVQDIEKDYLHKINLEWVKFVELTNDNRLIERYRAKLDQLQLEYKSISNDYQKDPNNLTFVEALLNNLENRLELLKEIQAHITILNNNYESTI